MAVTRCAYPRRPWRSGGVERPTGRRPRTRSTRRWPRRRAVSPRAGHGGGAVQPRRRGHPAAAGLRVARSGGRHRRGPRRGHLRHHLPAGGAARGVHARRPGQAARVHTGAGRRRAGRAGRRAGLFAPVAEHPATESALWPPTASCATCPPPRSTRSPASSGRAARGGAPPPRHPGPAGAEVVRRGGPARRGHGAGRHRRPPPSSGRSSSTSPSGSPSTAPACSCALAEHVPTTVIAGLTGVPAADAEVLRVAARGSGSTTAAPTRRRPGCRSPPSARWCSPPPTATRRCGPRCARSSTPCAPAPASTASPCSTPAPSPTPASPTSSSTRPASPPTAPPSCPLAARVAGPDAARAPRPARRRLPAPGRVRLAGVGAHPPRRPPRRPPAAWERLSREAAVVAGRDDWDDAPHAARRAQRARAAEAELDDDEPEWRAGRLRAEAERGPRAAAVRARPDRRPRAAAAPTPPVERARRVGPALARPASSAAPVGASGGTTRPSARRPSGSTRPSHRLGALDAVEGPVTLDVFHRTLELELEHDLGRVGRFGDGVLVGSVEMGIGLDLDLVVVLGPGRGSFPATVRDDSLLPDHERAARRRRARAAGRARRAPAPPAPRRAGRRPPPAALRAPRRPAPQRRARAVPLGARPLHPPRRAPTRGGGRPTSSTRREPWVRHVASFDAGLRQLDVPATAQEHRLRALLATGGDLARHRRRRHRARRRGGRGPPQRPLHPLRRQPRRPAGPVAGRPHHVAHPARALGRLPAPPPRAKTCSGPRRSRTPRTTS